MTLFNSHALLGKRFDRGVLQENYARATGYVLIKAHAGTTKMMNVCFQSLSFVSVALVWGITNPLLKKGSVGIEKITRPGRLRQLLAELKFLALRWQYLVPFLVNQTGSVLYYLTIGQADISLAVPITNSLTFLVTCVAGRLMGEKPLSVWTYCGLVLVLIGVICCIGSKVN